jgi:hypothetical protein
VDGRGSSHFRFTLRNGLLHFRTTLEAAGNGVELLTGWKEGTANPFEECGGGGMITVKAVVAVGVR